MERARQPDVPVIAEPRPFPDFDIPVHQLPLHVLDRFISEKLQCQGGELPAKVGKAYPHDLGALPGIFFPTKQPRPKRDGLGRAERQCADGKVAGVEAWGPGEIPEQTQLGLVLFLVVAPRQEPEEIYAEGSLPAAALRSDRE